MSTVPLIVDQIRHAVMFDLGVRDEYSIIIVFVYTSIDFVLLSVVIPFYITL